jgi:NAD(P)-dependent dehydrogenase (short-subunit alcohol dehydrogenase family)
MDLFDMTGRVAIVTGATRGIGLAIARAMAAAGASVTVTARTAADCEAVAAAIEAEGGRALAAPANVGRAEEVERMVAATEARFGPADVLVCNAAANPHYGPFLAIDDAAFDKTVAVNVRAQMRLCARVLPGMEGRGGGAVVVISSIAAFKGSVNLGTYALTKAADGQLVRNLAVAYGPRGIRANAIAPAVVRTDFARALWDDPEREARLAASYPLGRIGEPDDVAGAAVFLASRAGAWMTGQTLVIDGGWSVGDGSA